MFIKTIATASNKLIMIFNVGTSPNIVHVKIPKVKVAKPKPIGLMD